MVSQWVPLHSLNMDVVKSLVATYTSVFPYYTAWFINADLFLIGSNEPLAVDFEQIRERIARPEIRAALDPVGLGDAVELVNMCVMDQETLDACCAGHEIMVDDRPWAEFIAPRLANEREVGDSLRELGNFRQPPFEVVPEQTLTEVDREAIARRHASHETSFEALIEYREKGGISTAPEEMFLAALEIDPSNLHAQHYLKDIVTRKVPVFIKWGGEELEKAVDLLTKAKAAVPDEAVYDKLLADVRAAMADSGGS